MANSQHNAGQAPTDRASSSSEQASPDTNKTTIQDSAYRLISTDERREERRLLINILTNQLKMEDYTVTKPDEVNEETISRGIKLMDLCIALGSLVNEEQADKAASGGTAKGEGSA